jgi:hypothetical protein
MEDMQGLLEYISDYGNFSFDEKPFNAIDGLIFSQLVYTDFDGIIQNDNKVFLCDAAMKFFAKHTDEEIENLIGISVKSAKLLMSCAMLMMKLISNLQALTFCLMTIMCSLPLEVLM